MIGWKRNISVYSCLLIWGSSVSFLVSAQEDMVENCSLCPAGGSVTLPDRVIPQLGITSQEFPTCADAEAYATDAVIASTICDLLQSHAAFCGCEDESGVLLEKPSVVSCTLCANGTAPENPTLVTPFGDTCEELNDYMSYLSADECASERGENLLRNAFLCGCPGATDVATCTMCADGSLELQFPDRVIPFFNLDNGDDNPTCQQVADSAAVALPGSVNCDLVQAQAGYCGCPNNEPLLKCSFCSSGGEPKSMDLVTPSTDTCGDLFEYAKYVDEEGCESSRFQSIKGFAYICGCPDEVPPCLLCPDGSAVPDATKTLPDGQSCFAFQNVVESYPEKVCVDEKLNIAVAASRCDCPGAEVPICPLQDSSHLCSDELLAQIPNYDPKTCECAQFCDGEFFGCAPAPGELITAQQCTGMAISGCNPALIQANAQGTNAPGEGGPDEGTSSAAGVIAHAITVMQLVTFGMTCMLLS